MAARDAGAAHLWWNVVNLRPGTREHFLEHLARDWPEELDRYERLYRGRAYLPAPATRQLDATMAELRSEWVWAPRRNLRPQSPPPPSPAQLELPLAG
jgi:hypothetical protein